MPIIFENRNDVPYIARRTRYWRMGRSFPTACCWIWITDEDLYIICFKVTKEACCIRFPDNIRAHKWIQSCFRAYNKWAYRNISRSSFFGELFEQLCKKKGSPDWARLKLCQNVDICLGIFGRIHPRTLDYTVTLRNMPMNRFDPWRREKRERDRKQDRWWLDFVWKH